MKLSPKKQQGMTMISMIAIAIVIGSIFFLAIAVIPIYMDHSKVKGAMTSLKESSEAGGVDESPDQLLVRLLKMLGMNYVDNLVTKDNITISKQDNGRTQVHIEYEVVKKIVGNASILVQFDDTIEIK